jgi:hypothetical protein
MAAPFFLVCFALPAPATISSKCRQHEMFLPSSAELDLRTDGVHF